MHDSIEDAVSDIVSDFLNGATLHRKEEVDDNHFVCACCGETHDKFEAFELPDGVVICEDCKSNWYRKCENCGEWFDKRITGRMVGSKWYCDDCASDYRECAYCGEACHRYNMQRDHLGNWVCNDCVDNHYHTCANCGEICHEDYGRWCDDEEWRCDSCANDWETEHENSSGVIGYHEFNSDRYSPHRVNPNDPEEKLLMGVELECDDGEFDCNDFTWWTEEKDNLVHFEHDGSLSDDGVECITMPCSLRYHKEKMRWDDLCSRLNGCGFHSHNTSDCGLHVHMNRDALTPIQIVKMDVFCNRGVAFWSQIGRRKVIFNGNYDPSKMAKKDKGLRRYESHDSRYQVLNTCNSDTVELRFCRGTLNVETILGTLELFHAMPKYLDTIPIAHIYETEKNIMGFIKYVVENRHKYTNALPMMRRLVRHEGYAAKIGEYYGKYISARSDGEND